MKENHEQRVIRVIDTESGDYEDYKLSDREEAEADLRRMNEYEGYDRWVLEVQEVSPER